MLLPMTGLFVTGTDTGVGKTVLSALLMAGLRERDVPAAPMKPMQTGCSGGVPDLEYALSMASMTVDAETQCLMAPFCFEPACSPHLAAEQAETEIEIAEIVIAARTLAKRFPFLVVEGAGGILVPINRRETMLDLMQALRLPIVLAARPGLGTINHTLLSIRTLRADGLDIAGVVLVNSGNEPAGFIEQDNITTIEQFGNVPVLGTLPFAAELAKPLPQVERLPATVHAEVDAIISRLPLP